MYGQRPSVETRLQVLNFTDRDLTVGYRQGWNFRVPKRYDPEHHSLILRFTLTLPSLVEINAQHLLSVVQEQCSAELGLLKAALAPKIEEGNVLGGFDLVIDYSISVPELMRYGGTVYFHEVDLLVSVLSQDEAPLHPYSEKGHHQSAAVDHKHANGRFGYTIEIVDNLGEIGERYVNLNGRVFKITPKEDARKADGVYVSWSNAVTGKTSVPQTNRRRYDVAEAEAEFKLYRTYAEALNFGDEATTRKEELARLQHDNQVAQQALLNQKSDAESRNLQLQTDLTEITQRYELLKLERDNLIGQQQAEMKRKEMITKDHYEERSYVRKDSSEVVKVLPAIIVGLGAVIMAVGKFLGWF